MYFYVGILIKKKKNVYRQFESSVSQFRNLCVSKASQSAIIQKIVPYYFYLMNKKLLRNKILHLYFQFVICKNKITLLMFLCYIYDVITDRVSD